MAVLTKLPRIRFSCNRRFGFMNGRKIISDRKVQYSNNFRFLLKHYICIQKGTMERGGRLKIQPNLRETRKERSIAEIGNSQQAYHESLCPNYTHIYTY